MRVTTRYISSLTSAAALAAALLLPAAPQAPPLAPSLFTGFAWRPIGPFRGGLTRAVSGVPGSPTVIYAGTAYGGLWTTDDVGRTWRPVPGLPAASIGAVAVAPSQPRTLYVGSADETVSPGLAETSGVYRSADAGRTWTHLGLEAAHHVAALIVDPQDPGRVFVAVRGRAYAPSEDRGVFRSTDGGRSFERVLFRDADTGAIDLAFDPGSSRTIFAALWHARRSPWSGEIVEGPGSGVYRSVDGGSSWGAIGNGLPSAGEGLGRVSLAAAAHRPGRLYAAVQSRERAGLYRTDDGGSRWTRINGLASVVPTPGGTLDVEVDPSDPDVVYVLGEAAWKSGDGGLTFSRWREADRGGYHRLWLHPGEPGVLALAGDQGAVVSVNGGATWSSAFSQPTSEFHQVSADMSFPYRVCGAGVRDALCVASRSPEGRITARDWHPIGSDAGGFVAPDPADPDIVYTGQVTRYDRRTRLAQDVPPPRGPAFRTRGPAPLVVAPLGAQTLYFAANSIWKTSSGGQAWTEVSPDLSRETWDVPASFGTFPLPADRPAGRQGVISTIAPSTIDAAVLWAGTDDGLIHVTRDAGRTWINVTPPAVTAWAHVSAIEASHFDTSFAYAAIDRHRLDDLQPHVLRTKDGGRTWTAVVSGLPPGVVHVIREDPLRRGMLFAGTASGVFVSFDDGDRWQSLRLNMPPVAVADLVVKEEDLVVATRGRGLWILDDLMPLRQLTPDVARAAAFLFRPAAAYRTRWNVATVPELSDDPGGENPPDGVRLVYLLGSAPAGPGVLDVVDVTSGDVVRRFDVPAVPGLRRVIWDGRYPPPPGVPDTAAPRRAGPVPGVFVTPGTYQVRLTIDGRLYRQAVTVHLDPRQRTSNADLQLQFTLSRSIDRMLRRVAEAYAGAVRPAATAALGRAHETLADLLMSIQRLDARPTAAQQAAAADALAAAEAALALR